MTQATKQNIMQKGYAVGEFHLGKRGVDRKILETLFCHMAQSRCFSFIQLRTMC